MLIDCAICIGDIDVINDRVSVLNCGHIFHANCLNQCLGVKLSCPLCRQLVTIGSFAHTIYPKLNRDTADQMKILRGKCEDLQTEQKNLLDEIELLKIQNSSLKHRKFILSVYYSKKL